MLSSTLLPNTHRKIALPRMCPQPPWRNIEVSGVRMLIRSRSTTHASRPGTIQNPVSDRDAAGQLSRHHAQVADALRELKVAAREPASLHHEPDGEDGAEDEPGHHGRSKGRVFVEIGIMCLIWSESRRRHDGLTAQPAVAAHSLLREPCQVGVGTRSRICLQPPRSRQGTFGLPQPGTRRGSNGRQSHWNRSRNDELRRRGHGRRRPGRDPERRRRSDHAVGRRFHEGRRASRRPGRQASGGDQPAEHGLFDQAVHGPQDE